MIDFFTKFLEFIDSYPHWAKALVLAGVVLIMGTLVLSPRETASAAGTSTRPDPSSTVFIKIGAIQQLGGQPIEAIKLRVFVNQNSFQHPSVGNAEWMGIGPGMSHKIIELTPADSYRVRFEAIVKVDDQNITLDRDQAPNTQQHQSQTVFAISHEDLPRNDQYQLYRVENSTRSAAPSIGVEYSIYEEE